MMKILLNIILFPLNILSFIITMTVAIIIISFKLIGKLLEEAWDFLTDSEVFEKCISTTAAKVLIYAGILRVSDIAGYKKLDEKYLLKMGYQNFNMYQLYKFQAVSEDFLYAFKSKYKKNEWEAISLYQNISKQFIMDNSKTLNFGYLLINPYIKKQMKNDEELELYIRLNK